MEPLTLTVEDRTELDRRVRAQTTAHRDRQRAQVVLLAADGVSGRQIAREVRLSPQAVSKWRIRFRDLGLDGLDDAPRSGRPLVYGPTDRLVLMAKVTSEHPEFSSQWSHSELREAMTTAGIPISSSQIGRILAADDVRPHKVDGWLTRRDTPEFWARAADVCGLYLSPPDNAVVLSIDEKTSIQAKSRKHPTTAARTGRPARREFEYVRHGTASLVAALDVATGKVTARDIARNDSAHFIEFLEELDAKIDADLTVHVVLDNGSSHTSKATKAWFAAHPRFVVHHTPAHASWLNQVECFFSILTRKLLRRGEFDSREDLVAKLMAFIAHHCETAKPFRWVYDAKVAA
ncbi:MAG TPA: IS630 family transposase [Vicinamibacterales bacterium]